MARILVISALCLTFGCASSSKAGGVEQGKQASQVSGAAYRTRYPLKNAEQKLVSNTGTGFSALYGTRNFRAVLNGVYYRGGANNAYYVPKRPNSNPIPDEGLRNLCEEGFSEAVYLYSTNFDSAPHTLRCKTFDGQENQLTYHQISPLAYRESDQRTLLTMILEHVRNPRLGPIYDHCWNGWHASGFVAAITLRQFCGFSAAQAVAYWNKNTDGNNSGNPNYDEVRSHIRAFQPFSDLSLTPEEQKILCPAPESLSFL